MNNKPLQPQAAPSRFARLKIAAFIWVLFCLLLSVTKVFGFQCFPSLEWISLINTVSTITGIFTAVLMLVFLLYTDRDFEKKPVKNAIFFIVFPFLGYVIGKNSVFIAVPMIFAIFFGYQTELVFMVSSIGEGGRRCSNPINVDGLPVFFDSICNFPQSVTRDIKPGDRIMVGGRGTSLGVFASRIRRVE